MQPNGAGCIGWALSSHTSLLDLSSASQNTRRICIWLTRPGVTPTSLQWASLPHWKSCIWPSTFCSTVLLAMEVGKGPSWPGHSSLHLSCSPVYRMNMCKMHYSSTSKMTSLWCQKMYIYVWADINIHPQNNFASWKPAWMEMARRRCKPWWRMEPLLFSVWSHLTSLQIHLSLSTHTPIQTPGVCIGKSGPQGQNTTWPARSFQNSVEVASSMQWRQLWTKHEGSNPHICKLTGMIIACSPEVTRENCFSQPAHQLHTCWTPSATWRDKSLIFFQHNLDVLTVSFSAIPLISYWTFQGCLPSQARSETHWAKWSNTSAYTRWAVSGTWLCRSLCMTYFFSRWTPLMIIIYRECDTMFSTSAWPAGVADGALHGWSSHTGKTIVLPECMSGSVQCRT